MTAVTLGGGLFRYGIAAFVGIALGIFVGYGFFDFLYRCKAYTFGEWRLAFIYISSIIVLGPGGAFFGEFITEILIKYIL